MYIISIFFILDVGPFIRFGVGRTGRGEGMEIENVSELKDGRCVEDSISSSRDGCGKIRSDKVNVSLAWYPIQHKAYQFSTLRPRDGHA